MEAYLPPAAVDLVVSPLLIGEVLLRSLMETALSLLLPLLFLSAVGFWLVWRMRPDREADW